MFWPRVKSILVFVPLMLVVAYVGGVLFSLFFLVVLGVAAFEYGRLLKKMGYYISQPFLICGVVVLVLTRLVFGFEYADLALVALVMGVAVLALWRYETGDDAALHTFALHLSGILYLGWLGAYFLSLRALPDGRWWFIITLTLVWLADLGAYVFGTLWGRHKIMPRLSPKKSWEGWLGGILFGVGFGALIPLVLRPVFAGATSLEGAGLGLAIAVLTLFGDVFMSMLKRLANVKDSGNVIPGHGGILDRLDSWLWAAVIGYYFTLFIR